MYIYIGVFFNTTIIYAGSFAYVNWYLCLALGQHEAGLQARRLGKSLLAHLVQTCGIVLELPQVLGGAHENLGLGRGGLGRGVECRHDVAEDSKDGVEVLPSLPFELIVQLSLALSVALGRVSVRVGTVLVGGGAAAAGG